MPDDLIQELDRLREHLLTMCAMTIERTETALDAFLSRDLELAQSVRHGDRAVDVLDLDIEVEALRILALHSPVASDLRTVLATMRIGTDLERIADMAKGIAKRVLVLCDLPEGALPPQVNEMVGVCRSMLEETGRAIVEVDGELAKKIRLDDAALDGFYRKSLKLQAKQVEEGGPRARAVLDEINVVRLIERIGDVCTNIAEEIIFVSDGEIVRHIRPG